jgi:hypothetical protein
MSNVFDGKADQMAILEKVASPQAGVLQRSSSDVKLPSFLETAAPRNRDEWDSSTQATLCRVEALTRDVFDNVYKNQAAEAAARKAMQEHAKREREKQRVKVHAGCRRHEATIKASMKCMREIEHAVVQVEGAQGRMTAERYTRFAESKVCEHRIDLRSRRPGPELFRDTVQQLLEKEMHCLTSAREELLSQESECRRLLSELKAVFDEMAKDIGNRRLAMKKDISTISAGMDVELQNPECISDSGSQNMLQRGYEFIDLGLKLCTHSDEIVKRIKTEASVMTKRVANALALHTKELASFRAKLARQVVESEGAIDKAEQQLSRMLPRIEMGDVALKDTAGKLQALLRDLRATRQKTSEDLRNKTTALEIDNSCRKVTAQMASGEAPKKLVNSSSAPLLGSTNMAATTGKFNTTFLKASSGNPQQGDFLPELPTTDHLRHTAIGFTNSSATPKGSVAGGSSSLKAAARGFVQ